MMKGIIGKQISYMTLIEVHSTMHLMHSNQVSCNYYVRDTECCVVCMCVTLSVVCCMCVCDIERGVCVFVVSY